MPADVNLILIIVTISRRGKNQFSLSEKQAGRHASRKEVVQTVESKIKSKIVVILNQITQKFKQ